MVVYSLYFGFKLSMVRLDKWEKMKKQIGSHIIMTLLMQSCQLTQ